MDRGSGRLHGDGGADILWRHQTSGTCAVGDERRDAGSGDAVMTVAPAFEVVGSGDVEGQTGGRTSCGRHQAGGDVWIWLMNGATPESRFLLGVVTICSTACRARRFRRRWAGDYCGGSGDG